MQNSTPCLIRKEVPSEARWVPPVFSRAGSGEERELGLWVWKPPPAGTVRAARTTIRHLAGGTHGHSSQMTDLSAYPFGLRAVLNLSRIAGERAGERAARGRAASWES